ncbi:MAG: U32 family peptidase [Clostridia bacterium]|nr:U32 family peptidase [Clostridia bacterium]
MTNTTNKVELLAPAGSFEKMQTAFHVGADAVYLAGKSFGLRAFADNFTDEQLVQAVQYAHSLGKKVYVTVNVFAHNSDFDGLKDYLTVLQNAQVDAVIVSDLGVFSFVKANSSLAIHVSTQANTTNKHSVKAWTDMGAERVVLAREVGLKSIAEIKQFCPQTQLEAFVHGAMCISYSGRCLLSNYLTHRDGNKGECVQACRWNWQVKEESRDEWLPVQQDERGTYIFNSKDLNMLAHVGQLIQSGIDSFKIEGRMKSAFYVATTVNAYRRAIDAYYQGDLTPQLVSVLNADLNKASHRKYTTGFYFDEEQSRQYYESSRAVEESKFIAKVLDYQDGIVTVEQRNKFVVGDRLEILSAGDSFNKVFTVGEVVDDKGNDVKVCNIVQQTLRFKCPYPVAAGDILRLPVKDN